ncbi:FadR/GntR family transcriptional regulator [Pseudoprimorskyibacter insulae]|uniref:HTH-type transcriptional regulator LutR n=1 Tax=Pseudoprimorskyibacter insulae TaxID=1695997 RepID=A0A2R8AQS7_9RHOB|nr:FadR/GntR family transcriptional regulator [Pseudoprimorskyibacter insulae]SPF78184.1 HTH-type transcriptional regulator LutR [Pseudoprimorskyibacter insulae]
MTGSTAPQTPPARTRAMMIADALRQDIQSGRFRPGDRLPSEAELTRQHSVSRTVVREALGNLRSQGMVEARKGSGVFVLEPGPEANAKPFSDLDMERISGVIEMFELRSAFEIRAAGLAAIRRSAVQLDDIVRTSRAVASSFDLGESTRSADFDFHMEIAKATQNRRFPEFLTLIRQGIVPRVELEAHDGKPRAYTPNPDIVKEHDRIVDAIINGDGPAAEAAMEQHLEGSLARYRALLKTGG